MIKRFIVLVAAALMVWNSLSVLANGAVIQSTNAPSVAQSSAAETGSSGAWQAQADPAVLVVEANRLVATGQLESAEAKYRQALNAGLREVRAFANLATVQAQLNRLDEARKTVSEALAIDPNDITCLGLLGYLNLRAGKLDDALEVLNRAAQLKPNDPKIQNLLGLVLFQKGMYAKAETAFRKTLETDPGFADAHLNLARIYLAQRPQSSALARWHYRKALANGAQPDAALKAELGN